MYQEMDPVHIVLEILKQLVKYALAKVIDHCFEEIMMKAFGHRQVEVGGVEAEDATPGSMP